MIIPFVRTEYMCENWSDNSDTENAISNQS